MNVYTANMSVVAMTPAAVTGCVVLSSLGYENALFINDLNLSMTVSFPPESHDFTLPEHPNYTTFDPSKQTGGKIILF